MTFIPKRTDTTKLCVDCGEKYRIHKTCCRECSKARSKAYEKTPKGYLVRSYRNMYNRVTGVLKKKAHLYKGLPICDKQEFYDWSLSEGSPFLILLEEYKESGYDMAFAPSVDRVVVEKGYAIDNIQWITHSDNSSKTEKNVHPSLPVGIGYSDRNRRPFTVSKHVRGEHFLMSFYTLEEAELYLKEITT